MPNWCENRLGISGDIADVKTFIKKGIDENGKWCLDNYYPMPKELNNRDCNDWRIANWGTKWDVDVDGVNEDDDVIYFLSAWSPPCEWLSKVATDNPHLSFRLTYVEEGIFFAGISEFVKGRHAISEECDPIYVNEDGDELNASEINWDTDYVILACPYDY